MQLPERIERIKTDDLIPYARNSRTHTPEQIAQIAASMREFGFTNPGLIDAKNEIIAGHGRVMAAGEVGLDSVPCVRLGHLSDAQKRAYVIADNQLALNAGWDESMLRSELQDLATIDFDLDVIGFDADDLNDLLAADSEYENQQLDHIPEPPALPITRSGDLWELGKHRVMCGDSASQQDVEKLMNGKDIDLIFSDPPYGVSYSNKNKFLNNRDKGNRIQTPIENDHMSADEIGDLWSSVFTIWASYFADYSSYYIASASGSGLLELMLRSMNSCGMPCHHILIWNKNNHVLGRSDYNYKHEPILYGWAKKHKFYGGGAHKFSVWDIQKPLKNDLHPTMKPVALVENCILNSSKHGMLVADMFIGSGTTLIAAEQTGRICYGMELSPHYCDVIVKRWQNLTGRQAVHAETGKTFDDMAF